MLHVDLIVHVENKCQNSFGMFGPTEMRIVGILGAIAMYFIPVCYYDIFNHFLTQYDFVVFALSVIMFFILLFSIVKEGVKLHRQDIKNWIE
jgi:hypothetical protein